MWKTAVKDWHMKKYKFFLDTQRTIGYNTACVNDNIQLNTGCGSVWLEYLVWDQGVAGSNPVTPIFTGEYHW